MEMQIRIEIVVDSVAEATDIFTALNRRGVSTPSTQITPCEDELDAPIPYTITPAGVDACVVTESRDGYDLSTEQPEPEVVAPQEEPAKPKRTRRKPSDAIVPPPPPPATDNSDEAVRIAARDALVSLSRSHGAAVASRVFRRFGTQGQTVDHLDAGTLRALIDAVKAEATPSGDQFDLGVF
jgi:hypothetical protein